MGGGGLGADFFRVLFVDILTVVVDAIGDLMTAVVNLAAVSWRVSSATLVPFD